MLCLDRRGVVLSADGSLDRVTAFAWGGDALRFEVLGPFLAVACPSFVEIHSLAAGTVVESHRVHVEAACASADEGTGPCAHR